MSAPTLQKLQSLGHTADAVSLLNTLKPGAAQRLALQLDAQRLVDLLENRSAIPTQT